MKKQSFLTVFAAALLFAASSLYAAGPAPQMCHFSKKFYEPFMEIWYCVFQCPDGQTFDGRCDSFSGATLWNCPGTTLKYGHMPKSCPTKAEWKKRDQEEKKRLEKEAKARKAEEEKRLAERRRQEKEAHDKYVAEYGGTFVDPRDGRTYKTTVVGGVTWMAENLNYADSVATPSLLGKTACYGDKPKNCEKYGRLYSWSAVMDSVTTGCGKEKNCKLGGYLQGICPDGWRIPTEEDFSSLASQAAKDAGNNIETHLLMSLGYPEWDYAADLYGFSAIPAGYYEADSGFTGEGTSAKFWGASFKLFSSHFYDGVSRIRTPSFLYMTDRKDSRPGMGYFGNDRFQQVAYDVKYSVRCLQKPGNTVSNLKVPERMIDDSSFAYPVVRIGNRIWQAHNMGIKLSSSVCNDDPSLCKKHGRYYDYSDAKKACPAGWHIPTAQEWKELFEDAGSSFKNLMKQGEKGWPDAKDSFKFAVPASGYWVSNGNERTIKKLGYDACYWTEDDRDPYGYLPACIGVSGLDGMALSRMDSWQKFSVRCIMDEIQDSVQIAKWDSTRKAKYEARKKFQAARNEKIKQLQAECKLPKGCPFTDKRDGKTYGAAIFGNQVWMTENLDFDDRRGRCYNQRMEDYGREIETCGKSGEKRHGRLYPYLDRDNKDNLCPEGWRVPDKDDFKELVRFAGGYEKAGVKLKSNLTRGFLNTTTPVWGDGKNDECLGNDALSFSALPVGVEAEDYNGNVVPMSRGFAAAFWYIDPDNRSGQFELSCRKKEPARFTEENSSASIRCIKKME